MAGYKRKKKKEEEELPQTPKVNPELEGFNITIDSFGEIRNNFDIDKINAFLNRNVDDKKLRGRDDIPMEAPEDGADDDSFLEEPLDLDGHDAEDDDLSLPPREGDEL